MAPIDLAEEPLRGKIELVIDAVSEMFYSLHVLADPSHHLSNQAWAARTMEAMSPSLRATVQYFGQNFNQWLDISDVVQRIGRYGMQVPAFFEQLRALPAGELVEIALNGLGYEETGYPHEEPGESEVIAARAEARAQPEAFAARLVQTLEEYWSKIFVAEWERRLPLLEQRRAQEAARLDNMEPLAWLTSLTPRITYDSEQEVLVFHKAHELRFDLARLKKILCQPSTFTPPHLMVGYASNQVSICLNVPLTLAAPEIVPAQLLLALKALSDETRLRIFKLIVRQPRYTQELARSLKLAEPTVSRHLKVLQSANLVSSYKDGPVVRYVGSLEIVDQLPALMREFIRL